MSLLQSVRGRAFLVFCLFVAVPHAPADTLTIPSQVYGLGDVYAVAWSPDGARIAVAANRAVHIFDAQTRQRERVLFDSSDLVTFGHVATCIAFSPDSTRIAAGFSHGRAHLWDVVTGNELQIFTGHGDDITDIAYAPGGDRILTGSHDQSARLWNAATGDLLRTFAGHTGAVFDVAFSPDGQYILTASEDATAFLWPTVPPENAADAGWALYR
jgi:WD40 repeat protein